jgi:imidazolonepropionase-like amidohydrolase
MRGLKSLSSLVAILLVAGLGSCRSTPDGPVEGGLLISSVRVVDTVAGSVSEPRDVVIRDGRIASVSDAGSGCDGGRCESVDGAGQYLMPGLWDLHVHLESYKAPDDPELEPTSWYAPLAISYGVLGLRDLGSRTDEILALRAAWTVKREAGEAAPLLKVAGQSFSGKQPWTGTFDHILIPDTPDRAKEMVRTQLERGVDFIKVHDFIAPETYAAITQEAVAQGRRVVGHLRPYAGPLESAAAGQKDFDHLPPELLAYCGPDGAAATEAFYGGWYTGGPGYYEREMAALYDPAACGKLFEALAAAGASVTPTLSVRAPVRERTFEAAKRYLPEGYMTKCEESKRFRDVAGADIESYRAMIASVVAGLAAARVDILTGTDGVPESCGVPGLILLDELDYLVEAGLTRAQVLYAATRGAALKADAPDHGLVAGGAAADLVLLTGNPMADLAVLETPAAVISAGQLIGRDELLALRDGAAKYAQSLPKG